MTYEELLQELLKMTPNERKQNVVMVQEYGGNVFHPLHLNSMTSFSRDDYERDWEIVIR